MKTKLQSVMWSALLAAGLMAALPVAHAQQAGEPPAAGKKARREGGPGERLEKMKEMLALTDEQVAKLKPILAAEFEEMAAKRKELGKEASREARMEAMKAINEKYRPQIQAVLTEEQKAKLAKMRERGPKGPKGPDGAGGPPPPPDAGT